MTKILGVDVGFGDCKVVYGDADGTIDKLYKFNSVLGRVETSDHVNDKRVYNYFNNTYYVGELALSLESNKIIDLVSYTNLETFTPLIMRSVIENLPETPSIIVVGLSIAHVQNSGYFKEAIKKYLITQMNYPIEEVFVLPQGVGGKFAFDKYSLNFPEVSDKFTHNANYIGIDVGFNTIDTFQVVNNTTSSNLVKGLENEGIVKIVNKLQQDLKHKSNGKYEFSVKETKEFLDQGFFKVRGARFDLKNQINVLKSDYIAGVKALIEQNYGRVLDKTDEMRIFGGGAYILASTEDPFVKFPSKNAEYYNSIGQYLFGCTKFKERTNG